MSHNLSSIPGKQKNKKKENLQLINFGLPASMSSQLGALEGRVGSGCYRVLQHLALHRLTANRQTQAFTFRLLHDNEH